MRFQAAVLLLLFAAAVARAATPSEDEPLAGSDDTYVALQGYGCYGRCPMFDLYVFQDGRIVFRGRKYTPTLGVVNRSGSRALYQRLRDYLEKRKALGQREECSKGMWTDHPGVNVLAQDSAGLREGYWYFGSMCEEEVAMARDLYETFLIETNTANLVDLDARRWEKLSREREAARQAK